MSVKVALAVSKSKNVSNGDSWSLDGKAVNPKNKNVLTTHTFESVVNSYL